MLRALALELTALGHRVDVVTTTLTAIGERPARSSRTDEVDGATVRYLGTPLRFRWFGFTPGLTRALGALPRPDIVHVFGYRDWVSTVTARWCRVNGVPYVFEPLGMFRPKLRKVALKRALDGTLYRAVPRRAALAIGASERERHELEAVVPSERVVVRPNGFPAPYDPPPRPGPLRSRLGLDADCPARPLRRPGRARQGTRAPDRGGRLPRGRSARNCRPRRRPRPAARAARAARPPWRGRTRARARRGRVTPRPLRRRGRLRTSVRA